MTGHTVPDSVNPPVTGLEPPVDDDAAAIVADPRGVEPEVVDHRPAPSSNQQMAPRDGLFRAGDFDRSCYRAAGMGDLDDFNTAANDDAVAFKTIEENSDAFRIIVRKRLRSL